MVRAQGSRGVGEGAGLQEGVAVEGNWGVAVGDPRSPVLFPVAASRGSACPCKPACL